MGESWLVLRMASSCSVLRKAFSKVLKLRVHQREKLMVGNWLVLSKASSKALLTVSSMVLKSMAKSTAYSKAKSREKSRAYSKDEN